MEEEQPIIVAPESVGFDVKLKKIFDTSAAPEDNMPGWTWAARTDRAFESGWAMIEFLTRGSPHILQELSFKSERYQRLVLEVSLVYSALLMPDTCRADYCSGLAKGWIADGWQDVMIEEREGGGDLQVMIYKKI